MSGIYVDDEAVAYLARATRCSEEEARGFVEARHRYLVLIGVAHDPRAAGIEEERRRHADLMPGRLMVEDADQLLRYLARVTRVAPALLVKLYASEGLFMIGLSLIPREEAPWFRRWRGRRLRELAAAGTLEVAEVPARSEGARGGRAAEEGRNGEAYGDA